MEMHGIHLIRFDIDKLFFYYLILRQDFKTCITGSGQPQIIRKPLSEFKISIPQEKQEQKRIATIFSELDFEIEIMEKNLNKYRMIKQGMMQSLLTGKIRLV
jgi:type I restriction enzyme S subunit